MVFKLERRALPSIIPDGVNLGAGPLLSSRPALCAMLMDEAYADGSKRKTSTLLVFSDAGTLKACIRDRDTEETAWVSGYGLEGILDALEVGLVEVRLDWRKDGKRKRR